MHFRLFLSQIVSS